MTTTTHKAEQRRNRRLRQNTERFVRELHVTWDLVAGKKAPPRVGGDPVKQEWEAELERHFSAQREASDREQAAEWLTRIVHAAAEVDVHFQADLMAAAIAVGVYVPLKINLVHTLGPGRRSPVVANSTRVAWSRA